MEKTKKSKGLIWLIIILIIVILGLIGFIVYDKVLTTNNNLVDPTKSSTTKQTTIQTTNNNEEPQLDNKNTLKKDTFTYKLNNKEQKITYIYKYKTSSDYYSKEEYKDIDVELYKEQGDYIYNYVYLEILINNKKIENVEIPLYYDTEDTNIDTLINKIDLLSSDTINTIKGTDKEYFVFTIEHKNPMIDGGTNPLIISDEGKLIYTLELLDNGSLWSLDQTSKFYKKENEENYQQFIIEDTKLYYLIYRYDLNENSDKTYVQENYITIKNDKIEITEGSVTIGDGVGAY